MCKEKFEKIGLIVNEQKCKTTENNGEVVFMGQRFNQNTAISRSEELIKTAQDSIYVID